MQSQQPSSFPRAAATVRAVVFALTALSLSACAGFEWPTAPRDGLLPLGAECSRSYGRPAGERAVRRTAAASEQTTSCTYGGSAAYEKTLK